MDRTKEKGRTQVRPALHPALGVALLAILAAGCSDGTERGPIAETNPGAVPPVIETIGSARHVITTGPAERVLVDTLPPKGGATLLWFAGSPTQQTPDGALVTDGAGGLIRFDRDLKVRRVPLTLEGREIVSATAGPNGTLWVVDLNGDVLLARPNGDLESHLKSPFNYSEIGSDGKGGAWLVRSPVRFAYAIEQPGAPLMARIDPEGSLVGTAGLARLPEHILLADLDNAGRVAARGDTLYYAPFIRDQIVAFTASGDTAWIASRALPQSTTEPRFELQDGKAVIDYHPVNLGITIGPDDRLYVLSTTGFNDGETFETRLDVFDRADGTLLRTATLPTISPTLAVDPSGRVYLLDDLRLLTGLAPADRQAFAPFDLEQLTGDRMSSDHLHGSVTLINFWASWCAPCREEMPALDSLRKAIADPDFQFITMNEDVKVADAQAFIDEFGFDFPVLLGKGDLKATYHYFGLPYTVLVDRDGKLIQQWIGYAGPDQLARIRTVIDAELLRGPSGSGSHAKMDHGGH